MKIAYLLDWDIVSNSGVLNKVEMQVKMWESEGNEVFVCFTSYRTDNKFLIDVRHLRVFERSRLSLLYFNSLRTFIGKALSFQEVLQYLKEIKPEIIYYRQGGMWFPYLDKILRSFPSIMEVNSLDLKEIELSYSLINKLIYKYGRKRIINAVKGFVTVTNEIGQQFHAYKKPIEVIANGIRPINKITASNSTKKSIDLIFVGSPGQPWQGEDAVVHMAALLPEFNFHIVGFYDDDHPAQSNVHFYGYLNKQELSELYQNMDIGIGTLALYRKGMKEACPLKVREYLSWGLPIIIGYDDTDFKDVPFALNIGCYANNVSEHIDEIRNFIIQWKGKRVSEDMYMPLIGVEFKERRRLAFFDQTSTLS